MKKPATDNITENLHRIISNHTSLNKLQIRWPQILLLSIITIGIVAGVLSSSQSKNLKSKAFQSRQESVSVYKGDLPLKIEFPHSFINSSQEAHLKEPLTNITVKKQENVDIAITAPLSKQFVQSNTTLDIIGRANADKFIRYDLNYYLTNNPSQVFLIVSSATPILNNGLLGKWNTPNNTGNYTLQLTIYYLDTGGVQQSQSINVSVEVDNQLLQGWPVIIDDPNNVGIHVPPSISHDINGDGKDEILINFNNTLYLFNYQGKTLLSQRIRDDDTGFNFSIPTVADIDPNYPGEEIICYVDYLTINGSPFSGLMAWHNDGTPVEDWPSTPLGYPAPGTTGWYAPSILRTSQGIKIAHNEWSIGKTKIFDSQGNLETVITLPYPYHPFGTAAVVDFDNNGDDEIIIHGDQNGANEKLFVYKYDGTHYFSTGIPYYEINTFGAYAVGDFNGDGYKELIVVQETYNPLRGYVYVYDKNGDMLAGWSPRNITSDLNRVYDGVLNIGSSMADLNADNIPELYISIPAKVQNWDGYYKFILNYDIFGNSLPEFPKPPEHPRLFMSSNQIVGSKSVSSPGTAILTTGLEYPNGTYAYTVAPFNYYNGSLTLAAGYPKHICDDCQGIDASTIGKASDSSKEIIYTHQSKSPNFFMYAFEMDKNPQSNEFEWSHDYHDQRHTRTYELFGNFPSVSPTPTRTPTPTNTPTPTPTNPPLTPTSVPNAGKAIENTYTQPNQNNYVYFDDPNNTIPFTTQYTIELWTRPNAGTINMPILYDFLFGRYDANGNYYSYYLGIQASSNSNFGRPAFCVLNEAGNQEQCVDGLFTIPLNGSSWWHLAATRNGNELKLYLNGSLVNTYIASEPIMNIVSAKFVSGAYYYQNTFYQNGSARVDDIRISNIIRDIPSLWANGAYEQPLPADANTLALWRFDNDLSDIGPSHINGVINGQVNFVEGRVPYPPTSTPTPPPTAVFLDEFYARWLNQRNVKVVWTTLLETNNAGFNIWRGTNPKEPSVKINPTLIPSCSPGGNQGCSYNYTDLIPFINSKTQPVYYYWLEDIDLNGTVTRHGPVLAQQPASDN